MSALLDQLLTREQLAQCREHDRVVSGVMPLDTSRFPDSCAFEGAAPVVSYDAGQVIRESERENWALMAWGGVVVVALVLAACAVWPQGFAPF